jgi:hypothetical protein
VIIDNDKDKNIFVGYTNQEFFKERHSMNEVKRQFACAKCGQAATAAEGYEFGFSPFPVIPADLKAVARTIIAFCPSCIARSLRRKSAIRGIFAACLFIFAAYKYFGSKGIFFWDDDKNLIWEIPLVIAIGLGVSIFLLWTRKSQIINSLLDDQGMILSRWNLFVKKRFPLKNLDSLNEQLPEIKIGDPRSCLVAICPETFWETGHSCDLCESNTDNVPVLCWPLKAAYWNSVCVSRIANSSTWENRYSYVRDIQAHICEKCLKFNGPYGYLYGYKGILEPIKKTILEKIQKASGTPDEMAAFRLINVIKTLDEWDNIKKISASQRQKGL